MADRATTATTLEPRPAKRILRVGAGLHVLAAIVLSTLSHPIKAQTLCSEPLTPLCLQDGREVGWTALNWQRCRQDLERHLLDAKEYQSCLEKKLQKAVTETESLNNLIECAEETPDGCVRSNLTPEQQSTTGVAE